MAPPTLWLLLVARIGYAAVAVAVVWAALRSRRPGVLDAWSLAWIGSGALLSLTVQTTRPPDYYLPALSEALLVLIAWAILPNRFGLQALGAALVTACTLTWLVAFREPPPRAVALLIADSFLAVNLAGIWVSWRFHRMRRLQFLAEKEIVDGALRARESQERLQSVLDASTDGYRERDLVSGRVLHSARMNEITGRPAVDTWVGPDEWTARMHPDDLAQLGPIYGAVLSSSEERFDRMFRTRHADGSWRWVRSRGKVVARDGTGRAIRLAGTVSDVHAQTSAEEGLRSSEARLRSLIENLQAGVIVHGADTSIVLSNVKAGKVLGLTPDQMYGKAAIDPSWRFVHEDGRSMALEEYPVNRVIATRAPIVDQVVGVDLPASNDRAWALVTGYPVFRDEGHLDHVVVTFVDITRRKQVEEQLVVASRLAALGTLVAGVAHEINNPLTGELAGQGMAIEEIEVAMQALRADGAVDRGLVIARLEEAMRWLPASFPVTTTIRVENRGAVTIEVGSGSPGTARIEVKDDGVGMAPEVLRRVFDPYFTTRKAGQGTGLGLPICHSIVTAHGGAIMASSQPGRGSTIRVELPAADAPG